MPHRESGTLRLQTLDPPFLPSSVEPQDACLWGLPQPSCVAAFQLGSANGCGVPHFPGGNASTWGRGTHRGTSDSTMSYWAQVSPRPAFRAPATMKNGVRASLPRWALKPCCVSGPGAPLLRLPPPPRTVKWGDNDAPAPCQGGCTSRTRHSPAWRGAHRVVGLHTVTCALLLVLCPPAGRPGSMVEKPGAGWGPAEGATGRGGGQQGWGSQRAGYL